MSDAARANPIPANETKEHFLLKQIGLIWLKERGCQYVATEIDGMGGDTGADVSRKRIRRPSNVRSLGFDTTLDAWSRKAIESRTVVIERPRSVADVVGVQREHTGFIRETRTVVYKYTTRLIEVKVSRADFLSGYCTGAHYAYVMTPAGLVEPHELEPGIGLLEVDLSVIEAKRGPKGVAELVTVKRKPKRQERDSEDGRAIVDAIAAKHTNTAVWKNPWLIQQRRDRRE